MSQCGTIQRLIRKQNQKFFKREQRIKEGESFEMGDKTHLCPSFIKFQL